MAAFLNNCRFIPTAGGTTDWVYASAVGGCQSPSLAGAVDGRKYKFLAISSDLTQWEIAEGAYAAASGAFARTAVLYNSSGSGAASGQSGAGTRINFTVAPNVAVVGVKEDLLSIEEPNAFTATQMAQARANLGVTKKNYFINAGMQISQENGTTTVALGSAGALTYPVDQTFGVMASSGAGAANVAQVASATPGGSTHRIRVTVTAAQTTINAGDFCLLIQKIEGLRVADLKSGSASAKTVTVQFGCKGPAGTYCISVRNAAASRTYIGEYTIQPGEANTDVIKSLTFALDQTGTWASDNTAGLVIGWGLAVGSTYQQAAGAWGSTNTLASSNQFNLLSTSGNVFELFDIGIYEGAVAPPFQLPDAASELALCQRYYVKIAAGAQVYNGSASVQQMAATTPLPVCMRATPTCSVSTGAIQVAGINFVTSYTSSVAAGTWYNPVNVLANARL
ncbi:hypothetical protein [Bradyrhizobium sp. SEMIA]|uniref:hypothetical protein n=1 Tax=Bradyrhizobium sp. SEMIA TaxID=2597515 RepID=UPI0018A567F0|nr:hypothetical protein [Bradyrhizobium sp. SEMIA]QOG17271.1 hypothetical protein FOM02_07830 [Bradyrhizobium sp. SEMIA]